MFFLVISTVLSTFTFRPRSNITCDELGWKIKPETQGQCAASAVGEGGRCYRKEKWTYHEAFNVCDAVGGRLCRLEELVMNVAQGTGCDLDRELVWSEAACNMTAIDDEGGGSAANTGGDGDGSTEAADQARPIRGGHLLMMSMASLISKETTHCLDATAAAGSVRCCADAALNKQTNKQSKITTTLTTTTSARLTTTWSTTTLNAASTSSGSTATSTIATTTIAAATTASTPATTSSPSTLPTATTLTADHDGNADDGQKEGQRGRRQQQQPCPTKLEDYYASMASSRWTGGQLLYGGQLLWTDEEVARAPVAAFYIRNVNWTECAELCKSLQSCGGFGYRHDNQFCDLKHVSKIGTDDIVVVEKVAWAFYLRQIEYTCGTRTPTKPASTNAGTTTFTPDSSTTSLMTTTSISTTTVTKTTTTLRVQTTATITSTTTQTTATTTTDRGECFAHRFRGPLRQRRGAEKLRKSNEPSDSYSNCADQCSTTAECKSFSYRADRGRCWTFKTAGTVLGADITVEPDLAACKERCGRTQGCVGVYFWTTLSTDQQRCRGLVDLGESAGKTSAYDDYSYAKVGFEDAFVTTITTTTASTSSSSTITAVDWLKDIVIVDEITTAIAAPAPTTSSTTKMPATPSKGGANGSRGGVVVGSTAQVTTTTTTTKTKTKPLDTTKTTTPTTPEVGRYCSTYQACAGAGKVLVPFAAEVQCPPVADGGCTAAACCTETFIVARPFFAGDAGDLVDSFARWNTYPPCVLDRNGDPTTPGLPADMILYFARDINNPDHSGLVASLQAVMDADAPWRKCFNRLTTMGGNLSAAQDQYHTRQDEITWNLGPNMQFYRMLKHVAALATDAQSSGIFYYMEGDSIPVAPEWLDEVAEQIAVQQPFSALGGTYSGHNWKSFDDGVIKPALRHHLNGNAVYNVSHRLIQKALRGFGDAFEEAGHSSFDVAIAEILMEEEGVEAEDLAAENNDYKANGVFSNFAGTLVLPQDVASSTKIVHGGIYVENWPAPSCPRFANLDWYPGNLIHEAPNAATSLSLVVTDFANGRFGLFYDSLLAAQEYIYDSLTDDERGSCSGPPGKPEFAGLPYQDVIVMTDTQEPFRDATLAAFESEYPEYPRRTQLWWDLCRAPVATEWFMLATSDFTFASGFKLPIEVHAGSATAAPLIPFVDYDSEYCDRDCRLQIKADREAYPRLNRHVSQEHAVFHTRTRNAYCARLLAAAVAYDPDADDDGGGGGGGHGVDHRKGAATTTSNSSSSIVDESGSNAFVAAAAPSINGYFGYIEMEADTDKVGVCNGRQDDAICNTPTMLAGCRRQDVVGDSVRVRCAAACNACIAKDNNDAAATATPGSANDARDDDGGNVERESKPTYDWWERKGAGAGVNLYNRLKLQTAPGLLNHAPKPKRCEEDAAQIHAGGCPCIFPFFYDGKEYTGCAAVGGEAAFCPTSVNNMYEFVEDSDDWRYCIDGDDSEDADRVRKRSMLVRRTDNTTTTPAANIDSKVVAITFDSMDFSTARFDLLETSLQLGLQSVGVGEAEAKAAVITFAPGSVVATIQFAGGAEASARIARARKEDMKAFVLRHFDGTESRFTETTVAPWFIHEGSDGGGRSSSSNMNFVVASNSPAPYKKQQMLVASLALTVILLVAGIVAMYAMKPRTDTRKQAYMYKGEDVAAAGTDAGPNQAVPHHGSSNVSIKLGYNDDSSSVDSSKDARYRLAFGPLGLTLPPRRDAFPRLDLNNSDSDGRSLNSASSHSSHAPSPSSSTSLPRFKMNVVGVERNTNGRDGGSISSISSISSSGSNRDDDGGVLLLPAIRGAWQPFSAPPTVVHVGRASYTESMSAALWTVQHSEC
eukprot:gene3773-15587_t